MKKFLVLSTAILISLNPVFAKDSISWPQAAGPDGNWQIASEERAPVQWSVSQSQNVKWKKVLPEGGQSGIAVWGDKLFLTIMKSVELKEGQKKVNKTQLRGSTIQALCINADNGEILWNKEIVGTAQSQYMSGFSDSSTPSPATDGKYVWFVNASGKICCFDFKGTLIWERTWQPLEKLNGVKFPFNKQHEPILYNDLIINMEPLVDEQGERVKGWHYLYGIDKLTGEVKWISEDALTHYNTPSFNKLVDGKAAIMIGRGGPHKVPEAPVGYSLVDIKTGKTLWQYKAKKGDHALYNSVWNKKYSVWINFKNQIEVLDSSSGALLKKISLSDDVVIRSFNEATQEYDVFEGDYNKKSGKNIYPMWYSNIMVGEELYFLCSGSGYAHKNAGANYSIGRVNLRTERVEYLELPVRVTYSNQERKLIWGKSLKTETSNSRGLDVASDGRSKRDGWAWNFNANPVACKDIIYFTLMGGISYSIKTGTETLDANALVAVNDLGPAGKTWSLTTPSLVGKRIYQRTLKEVICIEKD